MLLYQIVLSNIIGKQIAIYTQLARCMYTCFIYVHNYIAKQVYICMYVCLTHQHFQSLVNSCYKSIKHM